MPHRLCHKLDVFVADSDRDKRIQGCQMIKLDTLDLQIKKLDLTWMLDTEHSKLNICVLYLDSNRSSYENFYVAI